LERARTLRRTIPSQAHEAEVKKVGKNANREGSRKGEGNWDACQLKAIACN
jgi:hypothetical protein